MEQNRNSLRLHFMVIGRAPSFAVSLTHCALILAAFATPALAQNAAESKPVARADFSAEDVRVARAYLEAEKKVRLAETRELRKSIAELRERKRKLIASEATEPQKAAWIKDVENEIAAQEARVARLDGQVQNKLRYDKEWDYSDVLKIGKLPQSTGVWSRPWKPMQIIDEDEVVIFRPQEQGKTGEPEIRWLTGLKTAEMSTTTALTEKQVNVWVIEDGRSKTTPDALKQIAAIRVVTLNGGCIDELREQGKK